VLLTTWDGAAVAYLDWESTPGHTFVSTLDPLAHFGHTGDADAARFLDLLIPWATRLCRRGDTLETTRRTAAGRIR
jgi:hypothetical protein